MGRDQVSDVCRLVVEAAADAGILSSGSGPFDQDDFTGQCQVLALGGGRDDTRDEERREREPGGAFVGWGADGSQ